MKVIRKAPPFPFQKETALCLGYFDSLHLGHYHLIQEAKKNAAEVALLTFDVAPKKVLHHQDNGELMQETDRFALFETWGVNLIIILPFLEVKDLSPQQFIDQYLKVYHPSLLVVGFDYHYGKDAKGDINLLKQSFPVRVLEEQKDAKGKYATSRIYHLIEEGEMEEVHHVLGRYYQIQGIVVHGYENGRKIGFPTANVQCTFPYVLPKKGVYAGFAKVQDTCYMAMINVGYHPTISPVQEKIIEAHLLDFHHDIYDAPITIFFVSFLREEKQFASMTALQAQLEHDKEQIRRLLNENSTKR